MLDSVRNDSRLASAAEKLLLLADVRGQLPTPVGQLIVAAGLVEPAESLLSDACIDQAPGYIAKKMRAVKGKVLALLDRQEREVHIRPDVSVNGPFKRLHEVGHHILPWQNDLAYVDDYYTLSPEVSARFELEASRVAAELLFQGDLLREHAATRRIRAKTVHDLSDDFGATIHSTFRRYIETHRKAVAGVVLERQPLCSTPPCFERQEAFSSDIWLTQFHDPRHWPFRLGTGPFAAISSSANDVASLLDAGAYMGPMRDTVEWPDLNGELHSMRIEAFTNTYRLFVMLHPVRRVSAV